MTTSHLHSRRRFVTAGVGALAVSASLGWLYRHELSADPGPLLADPRGILELPRSFSYQILQRAGDLMTDRFTVPPAPDGMACFAGPDHSWILMRNHEIHEGHPANPAMGYAANRGGGVTRLVMDRDDAHVRSSNFVLTGTSRNCAGGASPYGWLSCEETEEAGHGFVFLCNPFAVELQSPEPLPTLGRFSHEAVAFDPQSGISYMTEDKKDSAIYRHVPSSLERPFSSGALEALKIVGVDGFDLSTGRQRGERFVVEWVPVDEPQAEFESTRDQAHEQGGAFFSRGEGAFFAGRSAYFCSTNGGPARRGQLYRLDVGSGSKPDELTLVAQAEQADALDRPDNIAVAPWGDVFLAEDGKEPNGIHILKPDGQSVLLARNAMNNGGSEISGICFSPDGKWLFLNLQWEGLTLAVTGPFIEFAMGS
jgi:secreted PhoX family phosphatase